MITSGWGKNSFGVIWVALKRDINMKAEHQFKPGLFTVKQTEQT
uniref:Uncharacterized protein n=1 Tax=Anguilla anguilla TaxID=7936 RepID=A0A0E9XV13_ANGAN